MADMNFDKGTTKAPGDGVVATSDGFVVVAFVDTQEQARAAKAAVRALGPDYQHVNYDVRAHVGV